MEAFVPDALPPFPPLDTTSLIPLLSEAHTALGRLDAVTTLLPDANLFIYSFVRREAVLSSQIEGIRSSISDLMTYELREAPGVPLDDVREVSNYVDALDYAVEAIDQGAGITADLLCDAHGILLDSTRGADKEPGSFRSRLNWIHGRHPLVADYVPPPPEEVGASMEALLRFIDSDNDMSILVRAALAHAQFETIHPFLDGNGRVGRLLISLMLHQRQALGSPLLYLSLYLKQRRSTYYHLLNEVRRQGEWEAWIDFFLDGVRSTADAAVDMARRLADLVRADRLRIQRELSRSASPQAVHQSLSERPIHTIQGLADMSGLSWTAVRAALNRLTQLGVVRETTGRRRDRIYAYQDYIDILSEDLEPI